ncbi:MAG: tryptophan 2,3-dioxygenase [Gammaproteobacteria bacterium]|nr:MAG: tryptophan 2,3-dioxygenase [Gammaproteobacteria bacterium]
MKENQAVNYTSYLNLEKILSAQKLRSEDTESGSEHDELLFIIIHQVFELWFKQLLHEFDYCQKQLNASELGSSLHVLKRVRNIVKVMVSQVDVIETMTPRDFSAFRKLLDSASGLQSYQFREIEFTLGFKRADVLSRYDESSVAYINLTKRLNQPSLWDAFLHFVHSRGYDIPEDALSKSKTTEIEASDAVIGVIEKIYHNDPELTQLCESLIDVDEGLQEWRYRHVKMVQRTIGMKMGTGGSDGVNYLLQSLIKPFFPDLWDVRSRL